MIKKKSFFCLGFSPSSLYSFHFRLRSCFFFLLKFSSQHLFPKYHALLFTHSHYERFFHILFRLKFPHSPTSVPLFFSFPLCVLFIAFLPHCQPFQFYFLSFYSCLSSFFFSGSRITLSLDSALKAVSTALARNREEKLHYTQ